MSAAKMIRSARPGRKSLVRLALLIMAGFMVLLAIPATAQAAQAKVKDSTSRIQALLNNPVNGVVNLPSGTFTIRPVLRLQRGEKIVGHRTTLKVAARSGNYLAVLAGASPSTDLSGLSITGVTFDQNAAGNPMAKAQALYHGQPRFVILTSKGAGINISHDKFLNTNNVNTVVTGSATSQVTISGNAFLGGITRPWHDHSSVYTSGIGTVISNNTFVGSHDIAAIEVHGDQVTVAGNKVRGYYRGVNIASPHTTLRGNTIIGALGPVDLWSTVAPGLNHVVISGNRLNRDLPGWARVLRSMGLPMPSAKATMQVSKDATSTYPFRAITIRGNRG